jgi:hypothetical protein
VYGIRVVVIRVPRRMAHIDAVCQLVDEMPGIVRSPPARATAAVDTRDDVLGRPGPPRPSAHADKA